jgi:hypothetical protein
MRSLHLIITFASFLLACKNKETDGKKPIDAKAVDIHTIFGIGRWILYQLEMFISLPASSKGNPYLRINRPIFC